MSIATLFQINWQTVLVPALPVGEIVLRGTVIYFFLLGVLRVLRREAGSIGISDLLVVVLIADAAQNGMAGEYKSITEGIILVATIALWDYALDWFGFRFSWVRHLLRPAPILLIRDGRLQRRSLRQELITQDELMGLLREQGVERVEAVKTCYLEADGHISVVLKDGREKGRGHNASPA